MVPAPRKKTGEDSVPEEKEVGDKQPLVVEEVRVEYESMDGIEDHGGLIELGNQEEPIYVAPK
ncbi:hypothetical protein KI387_011568, partial [Taxus chinensis]